MEIIYGILEQGLIYGLVGIAVFLTLRIIDFPDMGVNSTFTLGAAVWICCVKHDLGPFTATIIAFFAGIIAGYITSCLHLFGGIRNLLCGIIIMIALYSVNMRIIGKPNVPLMNTETILTTDDVMKTITLFAIVFICCMLVSMFMLSEIGLAMRVSGQNYRLGETYGISRNLTVSTIMALSNGMVALAGALLGQAQGFIDINMGNGVIIIGLVSVIIGEKIFNTSKVYITIFMSVAGAMIYKSVVVLALFSSDIGLRTSDIYLITAVLIVAMMVKKQSH